MKKVVAAVPVTLLLLVGCATTETISQSPSGIVLHGSGSSIKEVTNQAMTHCTKYEMGAVLDKMQDAGTSYIYSGSIIIPISNKTYHFNCDAVAEYIQFELDSTASNPASCKSEHLPGPSYVYGDCD